MRGLGEFCARLGRDEQGATAIEYALLAAVVAIAIMAAVGAVGTALQGIFANPDLAQALGE